MRRLPLRAQTDWNKDFKPAPLPTTEAERLAAAKKYNLLPEEYKPYADNGLGYGDYPQLPEVSVERRDPYYPYDYPELKRNFNEPVRFGQWRWLRHYFRYHFKLYKMKHKTKQSRLINFTSVKSSQLHANIDLIGEDRIGSAEPPRFSMQAQALSFVGVMIGTFILYYALEDYKMYRPVSAKQYPSDGPHYTFETAHK